MKKTFIAFALAIVFLSVFQNAYSQQQKTSVSIYGGLNIATLYGSSGGGSRNYRAIAGYNLGAQLQIHAFGEFYLQPGISLISKGTAYNSGQRLRVLYTDIPVNLNFITPVGDGNLIAGAGLYLGLGTSGKLSHTDGKDVKFAFRNNVSDSEVKAGNVYLKRNDFGLSTVLGYEFANKVSLVFDSQFGLFSLTPKVDGKRNPNRLHTVEAAVTVGYRF